MSACQKVLQLKTIGGLCSRLRVILPAIGYCEKTNRRLIIGWGPHGNKKVNNGRVEALFGDMWLHPFEEDNVSAYVSGCKDRIGIRDSREEIILNTCHPEKLSPEMLDEPVSEYMNRLTPTEELQNLINEVQIPEFCVGVIIRQSVAQPGAESSEWVIERMQVIKDAAPHVTFYLYSDTRLASRAVRQRFSVVEQIREYKYNRRGIMESAASLYHFAQCQWILGSFHSSYAQVASWMQSHGPDPSVWNKFQSLKQEEKVDPLEWPVGSNYEDSRRPANGWRDALCMH